MNGIWSRMRDADRRKSRRKKRSLAPKAEGLESRRLLDGGAGFDYVTSGFTWNNPTKITYSIPTDGVYWDYGVNDLNATLAREFGGDSWKREFARALQTWAANANINVVPVADSNANFNAYGASQSDPGFGDIRIGGYDFNDTRILAQTYYPPPNSVSAAGDIEVNTGFDWSPGASYDFYSVMLHESGHSLGLAHAPNPTAVMNEFYGGVRAGLTEADRAGIQALYGPRVADPQNAAGRAVSLDTALDLSSRIVGNSAELTGVWLTSIGETDYYSVTVPRLEGATLQVTAKASGTSSLSPHVSVVDASTNRVGSSSRPDLWGNDVAVAVAGVVSGDRYTIAVTGATDDVFAVGAYRLEIRFVGGRTTEPPQSPGSPTPEIPFPLPPAPTPSPRIEPDRFESNETPARAVNLGRVAQRAVAGLSIHTTADLDHYRIQAARTGTMTIQVPGGSIRVLGPNGAAVAVGTGVVSVRVPRSGNRYVIVVSSSTTISSYSLGVSIQPEARLRRRAGQRLSSLSVLELGTAAVATPIPTATTRQTDTRSRRNKPGR
ncbi:MAG: matrixin family metalloprotease [Isosphaeraceae bacterium]|nr:matrixin family metalloprotease [Isosphaeraceae bacterium]